MSFLSKFAAAAMLVPLAVAPLAALAQDKPAQVARQDLMDRNSDAMKVLAAMAKGEQPFDAAVAQAQLKIVADDTEQFVTLFPAGTETGHDTRAKPEIWSDRAGFDARAADMVTAANAASEAAAGGLDGFRAAFGPVGRACGACHDPFRAPRS